MIRTIYAIGDIHGDLDQLRAIHSFIDADITTQLAVDPVIIHIGDLVDRRPDSKGVIDHLMTGSNAGKPWVVLRGNHDRLFTMFLKDPHAADPILRPDYTWLHPRMGGRETLASYGVEYSDDKSLEHLQTEALAAVPDSHLAYLENLPNVWQSDTHFFCHAGVKPGVPLDDQIEDDLIWVRKPFHISTENYAKVIVHGHTPIDDVTHYGNRINIDTGAAYGKRLSAIVLDETGVWQVTASGRREILHLPPGNI